MTPIKGIGAPRLGCDEHRRRGRYDGSFADRQAARSGMDRPFRTPLRHRRSRERMPGHAIVCEDPPKGLPRPSEDALVPFGGDQAHKAFALAVGLQLLVDALAGDGLGAVLVVARPEADPVPALRERAAGARLPGDR